jgi:hypothetical protein
LKLREYGRRLQRKSKLPRWAGNPEHPMAVNNDYFSDFKLPAELLGSGASDVNIAFGQSWDAASNKAASEFTLAPNLLSFPVDASGFNLANVDFGFGSTKAPTADFTFGTAGLNGTGIGGYSSAPLPELDLTTISLGTTSLLGLEGTASFSPDFKVSNPLAAFAFDIKPESKTEADTLRALGQPDDATLVAGPAMTKPKFSEEPDSINDYLGLPDPSKTTKPKTPANIKSEPAQTGITGDPVADKFLRGVDGSVNSGARLSDPATNGDNTLKWLKKVTNDPATTPEQLQDYTKQAAAKLQQYEQNGTLFAPNKDLLVNQIKVNEKSASIPISTFTNQIISGTQVSAELASEATVKPTGTPIDYNVLVPAKLSGTSGGYTTVTSNNPLTTGNNPYVTQVPNDKLKGMDSLTTGAVGFVHGVSEPVMSTAKWLKELNIPYVSDAAGKVKVSLDADLNSYISQGYDPESTAGQIGRGLGTTALFVAGGEGLGITKGITWAAESLPFVRTAAAGVGTLLSNPVVQKTGQVATGIVVGNNIADGDYRSAILNGGMGAAIFKSSPTPSVTQGTKSANVQPAEIAPNPYTIEGAPTPLTRREIANPAESIANQSKLVNGKGNARPQSDLNFDPLAPSGTPSAIGNGGAGTIQFVSKNGQPIEFNPTFTAPHNTSAGSIGVQVMDPATGMISSVQVPITKTTPQLPTPGQVITPLTGQELKEAALSKVGDKLFGPIGTTVGDTTYAGFSNNYKVEGLLAGVDKNFAQMQRGAKVLQDGANETAVEIFSPISTSWSKNASENQKIVTTMLSKDYKDTSKVLSNTLNVIKSPEFGYVTDAAKYAAAGNIGGQILSGDAQWYFNTPRKDVEKINEAGDLANAAKKSNFTGLILNANDTGSVPGYAGVFGYNGSFEDTAPKQGFVRIFSGNKPSTIGLNTIQQTVLSPVDWNMGALVGNEHLNIRGSASVRLGPAWVTPNTIRTADGQPGIKGATTIGGAMSIIAPAVTFPVPNLQDGKLNFDNSLMVGTRQVAPLAVGGYMSTFTNPFTIELPDSGAKSPSIWIAPKIHKENPLQDYIPIVNKFDAKIDNTPPANPKYTIAPLGLPGQ